MQHEQLLCCLSIALEILECWKKNLAIETNALSCSRVRCSTAFATKDFQNGMSDAEESKSEA